MLERIVRDKGGKSLFLLATRLANCLGKSPEYRAGHDATSDQGVREFLRRPETRALAYQNVLRRLADNPALAIDVLSREDISLTNRVEVLNRLITSNDFKRVAMKNFISFPRPPRFFSTLAKQPDEVVARVHSFWRHFDGSTGSTANRNVVAEPVGKNLEALVNGFEIKSYRIGKHVFNLMRSESQPYPWEKGDAILAFNLGDLHYSLKNSLTVRSEGFYSADDIYHCRGAISGCNSDISAVITDGLSQGPLVISIRRDTFSAPIVVDLLTEVNKDGSRRQWVFNVICIP